MLAVLPRWPGEPGLQLSRAGGGGQGSSTAELGDGRGLQGSADGAAGGLDAVSGEQQQGQGVGVAAGISGVEVQQLREPAGKG